MSLFFRSAGVRQLAVLSPPTSDMRQRGAASRRSGKVTQQTEIVNLNHFGPGTKILLVGSMSTQPA